MNPEAERKNLEHFLEAKFSQKINIKNLIADKIPVSRSAAASVFLNDKNQMFCFIASRSQMNVGDVRKVLRRMNLAYEDFIPPKNQKDYFESVASRKFREVFPGTTTVRESDLAYYKLLVPYNPALALIGEVREGAIKQFDPDAVGNWRTAIKITYRRIKTI